ncbi:MAG: hypothetical protein ACK4SA_24760, partial [Caldilinea sp.]
MTTQDEPTLPLPQPSADSIAGVKPGRGLSVLIAEDEMVMRTLLTQSMQRLGFTVVEAMDGEEALARFAE